MIVLGGTICGPGDQAGFATHKKNTVNPELFSPLFFQLAKPYIFSLLCLVMGGRFIKEIVDIQDMCANAFIGQSQDSLAPIIILSVLVKCNSELGL